MGALKLAIVGAGIKGGSQPWKRGGVLKNRKKLVYSRRKRGTCAGNARLPPVEGGKSEGMETRKKLLSGN